jgi:hypothetical protein
VGADAGGLYAQYAVGGGSSAAVGLPPPPPPVPVGHAQSLPLQQHQQDDVRALRVQALGKTHAS